MDARKSSRRRIGSITVDHAARVSVIPAPTTGCRCHSGAGEAVLSGCVSPATRGEDPPIPTARVRPTQPISECNTYEVMFVTL